MWVRVYLILFLAINLTYIYLQPLRVGTLWYLHVCSGDECFRWIKCKAVLFRSQLQLTWVEAAGGNAIISLDLLNCHEVRSVPLLNHALPGTTSCEGSGPRRSASGGIEGYVFSRRASHLVY
jgi:hypothetical protein